VLGRSFKTSFLSGAHPEAVNRERLDDELDELNRKGFVEIESEDQESYLFKHSVIQEVAYESLPFGLRHSLHRKIGEFIETTFEDSLDEQIDALAHHFFSGEDWSRALDYKLEAARHALDRYANEDAIGAAEDALSAGDHSDLEPSALSVKILSGHEILGEVLRVVGRYDDSLRQYGFARALAASAPPLTGVREQELARLCHATAAIYELRSEFETALQWVEKGLEQLPADATTIEQVRLFILRAGIFSRIAKYDEAATWAKRGLTAAEYLSSRDADQAAAQSHYLLGAIYYRQGALDKAVDHCERSAESYGEINDVVGQATAYTNLGSTYGLLGDWNSARQALEKSQAIHRKTGDVQRYGFVMNNLGNITFDQGEYDKAAQLFTESNSIWKNIGATLPEAVTISNLGEVYIRQRKFSEAQSALEIAQELFSQAGSSTYLPELERRWAQLYLASDESDRALENINRSIQLASEQEAQFELGISLRTLAEVQLARRNFNAAESALKECLSIMEEQNHDYEIAKAKLLLIEVAIEADLPIDRESLNWVIGTFIRLGAKQYIEEGERVQERIKELEAK
jgi:tetratricopeptide (TPR) repeat protein